MRRMTVLLGVAALTLGACDKNDSGNSSAAQTGEAKDAAGSKTIASGLTADTRFAQLAKAAGLDQTLAGPGPYTVLVPDDAAFAKVPAETSAAWGKPEGRAEVTRILTYHILPGFVLAEDIGKAIDTGKGKASIMTTGGGTLTATRQDGKIVLTDANGGKATLVRTDEKYTNGVVHHIDGVLTPAKG